MAALIQVGRQIPAAGTLGHLVHTATLTEPWAYGKPYGWAIGLDGEPGVPSFRRLERLADLSHVRWHFTQQSHEVHADASGWESNVLEHNGQTYLTTDRVHFGLAEPAHLALMSLHQCAASLFGGADEDIRTQDVLALKALAQLVNEAGDILARNEETVLRADDRRGEFR